MGFNFPDAPNLGQVFTPVTGRSYVFDGTVWKVPVAGDQPQNNFQLNIDGEGAVIGAGPLPIVAEVPYACMITGVRLYSSLVGSIAIDIWRTDYAGAPPTDANSITAAAPARLVSDIKSEDTVLTGWSTSLDEGDVLKFNIDTCAVCQYVTLVLDLVRV